MAPDGLERNAVGAEEEAWRGVDAAVHVNEERKSWD
jgi:hypothetical protein